MTLPRPPQGWRPLLPGSTKRAVHSLALVVLVDLGEFGVDHLLLAAARFGAPARARLGLGRGLSGLVLLVDRLAHLHRDLGKRLGLGLDRIGVVAFEGGPGLGDRRLDLGLQSFVDLVAMLLELLLGGMDEAVGLVALLGGLAALLVLVGELLGLLDHLLDIGVGKAARGLDADLLLLAGALV